MEATEAPKGAKAGEEDPSMEEILQSIRRIIAEDGDETKTDEAKPNGQKTSAMTEEVPGSDVLELTELVEEPAAPAAAASADVLNKIDEAIGEKVKPAAAPVPAAPAPVAAAPAPAAPAPVAPPAPVTAKPVPAPVAADALLSSAAASAATASLKKLEPPEPAGNGAITPSAAFASGNTVEAMVVAMLKPMLKDWLDANLPGIVERVVDREVKKLTR